MMQQEYAIQMELNQNSVLMDLTWSTQAPQEDFSKQSHKDKEHVKLANLHVTLPELFHYALKVSLVAIIMHLLHAMPLDPCH